MRVSLSSYTAAQVATRAIRERGYTVMVLVAFQDDLPAVLHLANYNRLVSDRHAWFVADGASIVQGLISNPAATSSDDRAEYRLLAGMMSWEAATRGLPRLQAVWDTLNPQACANPLFTVPARHFGGAALNPVAAYAYDGVAAL